jgi:hypothetical protein
VVRGGVAERTCAIASERSIVGHPGHSDCATVWPSGLGPTLGPPRAVGLGGHVLAALGAMVLPRRVGDLGQACRAWAPQVGAAPQESAGGPPLGWRARGLGEPTTAEQRGHLVGSARGVLRCPTRHGWHREGRGQDTGHALWGPQVGEPVPGEETFDGHDEAVPLRGHGVEQRVGSRWPVAVEPDVARVTQDADIPGAGRPGDAPVKGVRLGGEAPGGLLLFRA